MPQIPNASNVFGLHKNLVVLNMRSSHSNGVLEFTFPAEPGGWMRAAPQGQIRVFCRVRPLSEKESAKCSGEVAVTFPEEDVLVLASSSGDKSYEFDRVYNPQSTQESVFVDTEPLVTSVLDGYNVCIFAYGQVSEPLSQDPPHA